MHRDNQPRNFLLTTYATVNLQDNHHVGTSLTFEFALINHLGSEVEGKKQENSYTQSDSDPFIIYGLMILPGVMLHQIFTLCYL